MEELATRGGGADLVQPAAWARAALTLTFTLMKFYLEFTP